MTIDRAIQILTSDQENLLISSVADLRRAKSLGIEALNRIKEDRQFSGIRSTKPLPGETVE